MSRKAWFLVAALVAIVAGVTDAFGCPVCYGESDEQILKGVEMSVLFMIGLTYLLLLSSAVVTFFAYRRRLRRRSAARDEISSGPVAHDHEPALEGA